MFMVILHINETMQPNMIIIYSRTILFIRGLNQKAEITHTRSPCYLPPPQPKWKQNMLKKKKNTRKKQLSGEHTFLEDMFWQEKGGIIINVCHSLIHAKETVYTAHESNGMHTSQHVQRMVVVCIISGSLGRTSTFGRSYIAFGTEIN